MKKNPDHERYLVIDDKEGKAVYYLMQYIIDNYDAIEYIKFNKDKINDSRGEVEVYMEDGEEHRLDGPACIYADGKVDYYIEGEYRSASFWQDPRVLARIRKDRRDKLLKINESENGN